MVTIKIVKMKSFEEIILETLEIIPEEYFLKRNSSDEVIYIKLTSIGYKIATKGKEFFDAKGDKIPHYQLLPTEILKTKKETIENFIATQEKNRKGLIEVAKNRKNSE